MKFKDLFKAKDNSYYEVKQSSGISLYNPCYRIPETELIIEEYIPRPKYVKVFINRPWYKNQSIYILY